MHKNIRDHEKFRHYQSFILNKEVVLILQVRMNVCVCHGVTVHKLVVIQKTENTLLVRAQSTPRGSAGEITMNSM